MNSANIRHLYTIYHKLLIDNINLKKVKDLEKIIYKAQEEVDKIEEIVKMLDSNKELLKKYDFQILLKGKSIF